MGPSAALATLMNELRDLDQNGGPGYIVTPRGDNMFMWDIVLFGPPDSLYEGAYYKATLQFPDDYPYSPPQMKFTINVPYHPNVYPSGLVCISILHSQGMTELQSAAPPSERWNPAQSVRSIIMSVISMFSEPNVDSAANVDAAVDYRKMREQADRKRTGLQANSPKIEATDFYKKVSAQVAKTKEHAASDGVKIPNPSDWIEVQKNVAAPEPSLTQDNNTFDQDDWLIEDSNDDHGDD